MRTSSLNTPLTVTDLFDEYEESARTAAPFLCESNFRLSLHFEISGVQSLMDTRYPNRLMLGYTRTLTQFLLYQPRPRHIGMVGLGGGSLPKYCYHHLPDARISVAEISPEIIALRNEFRIPKDDGRFQVFWENGADFVRRHTDEFDVLLIDGFDSTGQPSELCSTEFYEECRHALSPNKTLVVNICDSGRSMLISRLRRTFPNGVLVTDGEDSTNTIAFAGNIYPAPTFASPLY